MYRPADQPLGLGKIFIESFKLLKQGFWKVMPFAIFAAVVGANLSSSLINDHNVFFNSMSLYQFHWTHMLKNLIISLIVCWCYVAIFAQYQALLENRAASFKQAAIQALSHFPFLFITMFIYSIAVCLGLVLFIFPGIILGVACTLAIVLVSIETKNPVMAMVASYRLVMPNWWRALIFPVIPFLLLLLIGYFANTFAKLLFINGMSNLNLILMLRMILSAILGIFFTVWFFSLNMIVLHDFRLRAAALNIQKVKKTNPSVESALNFLEENS